jgi:hypothetical protein
VESSGFVGVDGADETDRKLAVGLQTGEGVLVEMTPPLIDTPARIVTRWPASSPAADSPSSSRNRA